MAERARYSLVPATAIALMLGVSATAAQQDPGQQAADAETQVATQCLNDLAEFGQGLAVEGFWITGWGFTPGFGHGWAPGTDPMVPPATGPAPTAADPVQDPLLASPWGVVGLEASPRYDIRVLYLASQVLARQGDEEGCQYTLARMQQTHQHYVGQLQEAGIEPAMVADWRHEQIALAQPVTELPETFTITVDRFIGADVRSPRDEYLGSVADVVFDRQTHDIRYVVVARGGFLGIGEDLIPVPWEQFSMASGMHTLVLDVTPADLANAPQAAGGTPGPAFDEVDSYWAG